MGSCPVTEELTWVMVRVRARVRARVGVVPRHRGARLGLGGSARGRARGQG